MGQVRPIHIQVMAVMSDGTVVSLRMPTEPGDEAEFTYDVESNREDPASSQLTRRPQEISREVTFTARVLYRPPLDRDGGTHQMGMFGGAEPNGEVPARDVPEHVVAVLSQLLGGWGVESLSSARGSDAFNQAVRGQATLTGQWLWQQAWDAGFQNGVEMCTTGKRVVTGLPMHVPLFSEAGKARWIPEVCSLCLAAVDDVEAISDGRVEEARREVRVQPCGHTMWAPDPVKAVFR